MDINGFCLQNGCNNTLFPPIFSGGSRGIYGSVHPNCKKKNIFPLLPLEGFMQRFFVSLAQILTYFVCHFNAIKLEVFSAQVYEFRSNFNPPIMGRNVFDVGIGINEIPFPSMVESQRDLKIYYWTFFRMNKVLYLWSITLSFLQCVSSSCPRKRQHQLKLFFPTENTAPERPASSPAFNFVTL